MALFGAGILAKGETRVSIMTTSIKFSEIKNLLPITAERIEKIMAFNNTDFSDCPETTDENWWRAQPTHPVTKVPKVYVYVHLDTDVLGWFKVPGKGVPDAARCCPALRRAERVLG
jgi:uncharacterized protein (DUF4415 family)